MHGLTTMTPYVMRFMAESSAVGPLLCAAYHVVESGPHGFRRDFRREVSRPKRMAVLRVRKAAR